jgi:hypothetical protein
MHLLSRFTVAFPSADFLSLLDGVSSPLHTDTTMLNPRDWVQIVGFSVAAIGYLCLPHGQSGNAEENLSLFAQSAGSGAFLSIGVVVVCVGLVIVCLSFLVPRR